MTSYIAFGSNLGDRRMHIENAKKHFAEKGITLLRVSPLYETKALCRPDQEPMPDFINGVFEIETTQSPKDLLETLKKIENEMGRTSKGDWSPRVMDLDILFYGNDIIDSEDLKIPHPEIQNRWFVLKPLSDLIPDFKHPLLQKSIEELFKNLNA